MLYIGSCHNGKPTTDFFRWIFNDDYHHYSFNISREFSGRRQCEGYIGKYDTKRGGKREGKNSSYNNAVVLYLYYIGAV